MSMDANNQDYDISDIKFAVIAMQLGLIKETDAQIALNTMLQKGIEPTEENYAKTLLLMKYLTNDDLETLDEFTRIQAEICWCSDCSKNFVITNFHANRGYKCSKCGGPLYLVRSMKERFKLGELEAIDGFDPLAQPYNMQMQGVQPGQKHPKYHTVKIRKHPSEENPVTVFDSTLAGTEKTSKQDSESSSKIKRKSGFLQMLFSKKVGRREKDRESTIETEFSKKIKEVAETIDKKLKPGKSFISTLKDADIDLELTDLPAPRILGVKAKIFPETKKKAIDNDASISLTPIPTVGSKIQIASNDRYVLIKEIARGGMGVVYLAFDQDLRRHVAMKVIKPKKNLKLRHIHRFIQEAQILAQLEHPNNVPIHEFGITTQGHLFFTMKYIEGISFAYLISKYHRDDKAIRELYPLKKQLTLLLKVFDALSYAHARGVVHRDLKPENVMIGPFEEVVVMDWGLAKVGASRTIMISDDEKIVSSSKAESDTLATHDGQVVGTPTYMPPEQTSGKAEMIDERVDVYALGTIIYEIMCGRPPFIERDVWKLIKRIRHGDYPTPSMVSRRIDRKLERIIVRAMQREPKKRYQTVLDFKRDVENFLNLTIERDLKDPEFRKVKSKNPYIVSKQLKKAGISEKKPKKKPGKNIGSTNKTTQTTTASPKNIRKVTTASVQNKENSVNIQPDKAKHPSSEIIQNILMKNRPDPTSMIEKPDSSISDKIASDIKSMIEEEDEKVDTEKIKNNVERKNKKKINIKKSIPAKNEGRTEKKKMKFTDVISSKDASAVKNLEDAAKPETKPEITNVQTKPSESSRVRVEKLAEKSDFPTQFDKLSNTAYKKLQKKEKLELFGLKRLWVNFPKIWLLLLLLFVAASIILLVILLNK